MSIGDNIKLLRHRNHETQKQLGEALGLSEMAVSQWENGRAVPRMGSIERMAVHWQVTKSEIVGGADEVKVPLPSLTMREVSLILIYRELDDAGQLKLLDFADDLRLSGKYKSDGCDEGDTND